MAMKYLGETLNVAQEDGGLARFPHHENEIAQSRSITGKPFSRFWLHSEHLLVEWQKMSKSLGNFYTLRDLQDRGYKPEAVRYSLASVPYRKKLNFTFDGLDAANTAIQRLRNFKSRLEGEKLEAKATTVLASRRMRRCGSRRSVGRRPQYRRGFRSCVRICSRDQHGDR